MVGINNGVDKSWKEIEMLRPQTTPFCWVNQAPSTGRLAFVHISLKNYEYNCTRATASANNIIRPTRAAGVLFLRRWDDRDTLTGRSLTCPLRSNEWVHVPCHDILALRFRFLIIFDWWESNKCVSLMSNFIFSDKSICVPLICENVFLVDFLCVLIIWMLNFCFRKRKRWICVDLSNL